MDICRDIRTMANYTPPQQQPAGDGLRSCGNCGRQKQELFRAKQAERSSKDLAYIWQRRAEKLKEQLSQSNAEVHMLRQQMDQLSQKLIKTNSPLSNKDTDLCQSQKTENQQLKAQLSQSDAEVQMLRKQMDELSQKLMETNKDTELLCQSQKTENQQLKEQLSQSDTEVQMLRKQMDKLSQKLMDTNKDTELLCQSQNTTNQRGSTIWILGDSYIHRGEEVAFEMFGGPDFGLNAKVQWFGKGGMRWSGVLPMFYTQLATQSPPDILVIHNGGNDLGLMPAEELASVMQRDLTQLHAEFPSMKITFSCINERQAWRYGSPWAINNDRKMVNSRIKNTVVSLGGEVIEHPLLKHNDNKMFLRDRVHLTKEGNQVFLMSIHKTLKKILLHNSTMEETLTKEMAQKEQSWQARLNLLEEEKKKLLDLLSKEKEDFSKKLAETADQLSSKERELLQGQKTWQAKCEALEENLTKDIAEREQSWEARLNLLEEERKKLLDLLSKEKEDFSMKLAETADQLSSKESELLQSQKTWQAKCDALEETLTKDKAEREQTWEARINLLEEEKKLLEELTLKKPKKQKKTKRFFQSLCCW